MSEDATAVPGTIPVFVDTSKWYAVFDENDAEHLGYSLICDHSQPHVRLR